MIHTWLNSAEDRFCKNQIAMLAAKQMLYCMLMHDASRAGMKAPSMFKTFKKLKSMGSGLNKIGEVLGLAQEPRPVIVGWRHALQGFKITHLDQR